MVYACCPTCNSFVGISLILLPPLSVDHEAMRFNGGKGCRLLEFLPNSGAGGNGVFCYHYPDLMESSPGSGPPDEGFWPDLEGTSSPDSEDADFSVLKAAVMISGQQRG
ncbi:hypothetical protein ACLOJK_003879 [Asimina triloba]